jgi:hypothetical protein
MFFGFGGLEEAGQTVQNGTCLVLIPTKPEQASSESATM